MKIILIHSGGLDSSTLLYYLLDQGHKVQALGIDYGQRHRKELTQASYIAHEVGVRFDVADLTSITPLIAGTSTLITPDTEIPEGHYEDENMKATVVPNRNMLMLSVAGAIAVAREFNAVAYAAHAGDHTIYPDCRMKFAEAMRDALLLCDWKGIDLLRPFITMTKDKIASTAQELKVPIEKTWSCYKGDKIHCGRCGTCVERKEAFALAGVPDPTEYTDPIFGFVAYRG